MPRSKEIFPFDILGMCATDLAALVYGVYFSYFTDKHQPHALVSLY